MKKIKTHYSNLQVIEDASLEVIKGAHKHLSQKYHPDRNPNDRERCEHIMRILNEAYRVLTDPVLRKEHDEWISQQRSEAKETVQDGERDDWGSDDAVKGSQSVNDSMSNANREGELVYCRSCGTSISKYAKTCPKCGRPQASGKSKVTAGVLAILLGWLGIHRFYLGQWWGLFYLLFVWTYIPAVISLIEGIVFLLTNNEKWNEKYGNSGGGGGGALVAVIAAVLLVGIVGVMAAIAIPAYQDYTIRAKVAEGIDAASSLKGKVENYTVSNQEWPSQISDIGPVQVSSSPNFSEIGVAEGGVIYVAFSDGSGIPGKMVALLPWLDEQGYIIWECQGVDIDNKYLPSNCRN